MLAPDGMLQGHYRITYTVEERPDSLLYRAIDQRESLRVLVAALPQPSQAALEDVQSLARQIETVQVPGLLALRDHFADGLTYYLVSDDPGGQDLDRVARERGGPLAEDEVLRYIERLLTLLDTLHSRKPALLLGDLRSTDLWSSPDGDLSLAPFVLARHIGSEPSSYRALELYDAANEPTTSTDLYALGAVQYQLLTGWMPPTAPARAAGTPLNAPRTLNSRLSTLTEQMVLRALELKPANRYQQAREMRSAGETVRLMAGRPLGATAPLSSPLVQPPTAQLGQPPIIQPGQPPTAMPPISPPIQPFGPSILPPGYGPPPVATPFPVAPSAQPGAPMPSQPAGTLASNYNPVQYGAPTGQARKPLLSNGCLIALVVALGLAAIGICVMGAMLFFFVNSATASLPFIGGNPLQATSAPAAAATTAQPSTAPAQPSPSAAQGGALNGTAIFTTTRQLTETVLGASLYSPDGQYLAVAVGNAIRIYNATSLEQATVLSGHTGEVSALAFTPAGAAPLLASGSSAENSIRLWDLATGKQVANLEGHGGWIRGLAFAPDGGTLASSSTDNTARIWSVADRKSLLTLSGHSDWLGNLAFAPDGKRLATASRDGTVRLWEVEAGQQVSGFNFTAPTDPNSSAPYWLTGISFSPDSQTIAVGSTSGNIYMLDSANGTQRRILEGHTNWVVIRGVSFSPDGRTLATASLDGTVRLWSTASGAERGTLQYAGLRLLSVAWDGQGEQLVASSDMGGTVTVWNAESREIANTLQIGQGTVTSLAFSDDGNVLATGGAGGSVVLHILEGEQQITMNGAAPTAQYLAFIGETRLVALTSEGKVVVIDLTRQNPGESYDGLEGVALSVASTLDRRVLAAGNEQGDIAVWDVESKKLLRILRGLRGPIYNLSFSRDGSRLVAVTNQPGDAPTIALWDTSDGKLLQRIGGHSSPVTGLALRADASLLVSSGSDGVLKIWESASGKELRSIAVAEGQGWYSSVAFSPDGSLLATGTVGGQVELYNPETGEQLSSVQLNSGGVLALTFRLDGKQLAASTRDGGVWILDRTS